MISKTESFRKTKINNRRQTLIDQYETDQQLRKCFRGGAFEFLDAHESIIARCPCVYGSHVLAKGVVLKSRKVKVCRILDVNKNILRTTFVCDKNSKTSSKKIWAGVSLDCCNVLYGDTIEVASMWYRKEKVFRLDLQGTPLTTHKLLN